MAIEILNGRQVGVSRRGEGPAMLMLHCALAHRGALAGLAARLDGMALTLIDLPGHGETAFDPTLDIQLQAAENAIAMLEKQGPSHVFGHSFGATVALKIAVLRPELVLSLSLYEPVYFSLLATENPAAYQAEAQASAVFAAASAAQDWPAAARAFLARWSAEGYGSLPPAQQAYILKTIPLIMASEAAIIAPESGAAILAALPKLPMPILLLEGEESPAVIHAINDVIEAHANDITREHIAGVGHMGPLVSAARVGRIMRGFTGLK